MWRFNILGLTLVCVSGCFPPNSKVAPPPTPTSRHTAAPDAAAAASAKSDLPKVAAERLTVNRVTEAKAREATQLYTILSVESHPATTFVNYTLCPSGQAENDPLCVQGQLLGRYLKVPFLFSAPVHATFAACTETARLTLPVEPPCGPPTRFEYQQYGFNADLAATYRQLLLQKKALIEISSEYQEALRDFVDSATRCDLHNAKAKQYMDSKIRRADVITGFPANIIGTALGDSAEEAYHQLGEAAKEGLKMVRGALADTCDTLAESLGDPFCSVLNVVGQFGGGMLALLNPKPFIESTVHTVYDAIAVVNGDVDKLVPKACTAQQTYIQRKSILDRRAGDAQREYRATREKLSQLGFSTYVDTASLSP